MLTIRPAFTAFIRKETGLSVLGPECGQVPTPGGDHDRDLVQLAATGTPPQDPGARRTLETLLRTVSPEPAQAHNYKAAPYEGIFRLELYTVASESKQGSLFIDTTPNQEGVQYFFQPTAS